MAFLSIITDNILPLILFVAIGYLMDRQFHLNVASLTKLTFYVVLPCFIFYSIYSAELDINLLNVFLLCCIQMAILGAVGAFIGGCAASPRQDRSLQERHHVFQQRQHRRRPHRAGIHQCPLRRRRSVPLSGGSPRRLHHDPRPDEHDAQYPRPLSGRQGPSLPMDTVRVILHMPVLYTLFAVFAVKYIGFDMTVTPLWPIFQNCANALVAIVMMALGMQIHRSRISFGDIDAWIGCVVRLIIGPALAALLIFLWNTFGSGFSNVTSQVILIMSSVPSAVNSVLYAVEFKNYEDFATELVMMSTFVSCVTMTLTIYVARLLFPLPPV